MSDQHYCGHTPPCDPRDNLSPLLKAEKGGAYRVEKRGEYATAFYCAVVDPTGSVVKWCSIKSIAEEQADQLNSAHSSGWQAAMKRAQEIARAMNMFKQDSPIGEQVARALSEESHG